MQSFLSFLSKIGSGETFRVVADGEDSLERVKVSGCYGHEVASLFMSLAWEAENIKEKFDRDPDSSDSIRFVKLKNNSIFALR